MSWVQNELPNVCASISSLAIVIVQKTGREWHFKTRTRVIRDLPLFRIFLCRILRIAMITSLSAVLCVLLCILQYQPASLQNLDARVVNVERWERPLAGDPSDEVLAALGNKLSGVVVTLRNRSKWLVHKGDEFGNPSGTVISRADNMRTLWTRTLQRRIGNAVLEDYVRMGGPNYNLMFDNCHHATARMLRLT